MPNKQNTPELNEEQLEQVAGGAINVYDAPAPKQPYYKYTCHACGEVGIVVGCPSVCCTCKSTNIDREEYAPL